MGQRIYEVTFEMRSEGRWIRNAFIRNVAVVGGAEQATKVAVQREKDAQADGTPRIRVESMRILAEET